MDSMDIEDRTPDGIIFGAPAELADASDAERQAWLKELIRGGVTSGERARDLGYVGDAGSAEERPAPPAAPPQHAAVQHDYPTEAITLPDGREAWIHPLSHKERDWINLQVMRALRQRGYGKTPRTREEAEERDADVRYLSVSLAQPYAAVICLRSGPAPNAPLLYQRKDADRLAEQRGWAAVLELVALRCVELAAGTRTESELLLEVQAGFFERLQMWLKTCVSQLSEDSPDCWREVQARLDDFVTSVCNTRPHAGTVPEAARRLHALCLVMPVDQSEEAEEGGV